MHRRTLENTRATRTIRLAVTLGALGYIAFALLFMFGAGLSYNPGAFWYGAAALVAYPIVWAHILALGVGVGRVLVLAPREKKKCFTGCCNISSTPGFEDRNRG